MASQSFKSVYFPDFCDNTSRRTFKLAFGQNEELLFKAVRPLSSYDIRAILGHQSFLSLTGAAHTEGLALNTYCLRSLKVWSEERAPNRQTVLPGFDRFELYSTFRAGRTAPLHRWFPYLEGYSPEFVQYVIKSYAPKASRVMDPCAGVGTTPITCALAGIDSFYCELNPLLQFVIEAKVAALRLSSRERNRVAAELSKFADRWPDCVRKCAPDADLDLAYRSSFEHSEFFSKDAYANVLRARAALDRLACEDRLLSQFASVAVLGALIPSSYLCRAGDLRFRRDKELEDIQDFFTLSHRHMHTVADDIDSAEEMKGSPVLVAGDARRLSNIPALEMDLVLTSPPYLNGTNYFRNTKVELWFLRALRSKADLAAFRDSTITAGINDVRGPKRCSAAPDVVSIVRTLESCAYDSRIPKMVGSYFYDMERLLNALKLHLKPNATIAIDIGDSIYAGVRVPTDALLTSLAVNMGWELCDSVLLRTRVSRDTSPLKQVLLVFRNGTPKTVAPQARNALQPWQDSWRAFKTELPHQLPPLSKRNWGHPLHSLCSYQSKMKPSLASQLVRTFLPERGTLLDPFAGVGTIPFEAALRGSETYSFDISPAALIISRAKLALTASEQIEPLLAALENFIENNGLTSDEIAEASKIRFNHELNEYFHPHTFRQVLLARRFFKTNLPRGGGEALVMACLLHILHGNRPYALSRRSHPITPFAPSGRQEYKNLIANLRDKVRRALAAELPVSFKPGEIFECDATSSWPQHIQNLDAIITSPPFFDSTRFYLANWMRLWFAGWERHDFTTRPQLFVDELQKKSFSIYEPVFRQARERLKAGGVLLLHLGWSTKCDMQQQIEKVASPWFKVADRFSESVEHCESHGISDKGRVSRHQYLLLQ